MLGCPVEPLTCHGGGAAASSDESHSMASGEPARAAIAGGAQPAPGSSGKPTEKRSRVGSSCLPSPSAGLASLCRTIPGDAPLFTLFRVDATSIR